MDAFAARFFTSKLLEWASVHLRDYPWRHDRTFYRVLVAEILLQRTKADQVAAIYPAFIRDFPDFATLATATEADLLVHLRPLGLTRRTGLLSSLALGFTVRSKPPEHWTDAELSDLKGIGRYILHATRCFGQGQRRAIVDSNVVRIFGRFFGLQSTKAAAGTDPLLWAMAEELLPDADFVTYNYALIDFGSLICSPQKPKCDQCLLKQECTFNRI